MSASSEIKIEHYVSELESVTRDFEAIFGSLSLNELNFRPSGDQWSIAQNIDHLITVNLTYIPIIESALNGTLSLPYHSRFKFLVRMMGNMILKSVAPSRSKHIKTFPIWEPTVSDFGPTLLDDFRIHQEELIQLIKKSGKLLDEQTTIHSPANRNIVYSFEKALDIIIDHERRHFEQARELLNFQND